MSTKAVIPGATTAELATLNQPFEGVAALAPGADQVLAWLVHPSGGDVIFVQPSRDIATPILKTTKKTSEWHATSPRERSSCATSRQTDQACFDAGAYIADNVNLLLAVWDGKSSDGPGGTGSIVNRRQTVVRPIKIIWPHGAVRN